MCIEIIKGLLSEQAIRIYGALFAAYIVYRLGLRAFYKQKSYDNFQKRYLNEGIDLWSSQIDYALGVFRNNWTLMLRVLKQYRESEETLDMADFFNNFKEIDQSFFQISPNARVQALIGDNTFWLAYQKVFSFVGTTNDLLRADYALAIRDMQKTPNHKNKELFVKKAEEMAEKLSTEAAPCYDIMSSFHDLSELLAQSNYK